jgi:hypothetical protein
MAGGTRFQIGLGERFDGTTVKADLPGSVIALPGDTGHFHWAMSGGDMRRR